MSNSFILDKLMKSNCTIDRVTDRLDALKGIFLPGVVLESNRDGSVSVEGVGIKTVYQDVNTNVVLESYRMDQTYPIHSHDGNVEFLVVTKGKVIVTIGSVQRVMKRGECASIGIGVDHGVVALEDSDIIAVCVPPEKAYTIR